MRRIISVTIIFILISCVAYAANWWEEEKNEPASKAVNVQRGPQSAAKIDWEEGYIEVVGYASVDMAKMSNAAQAEMMAMEGARAQAYARLAEFLNGVAVSSETLVQNCLTTDQVTRTKVEGMIKGARLIEEKADFVKGAPKGIVRLGLLMKGANGIQMPLVKWTLRTEAEKAALFQPDAKALQSVQVNSGYTGIVIDAQGLGLTPAMMPKIVTKGGQVVYGPKLVFKGMVNRGMIERNGFIGYTGNLKSAAAQGRIGNNPLVLKAQSLFGAQKAGVSISTGDALKVLAVNAKDGLLKMAKVMFLM
jgi:hypothetical protein